MHIVIEQVRALVSMFPALPKVAKTLNQANISWAVCGSAGLFVCGVQRRPGDADIFLRDEDHDRVDQLFGVESKGYSSPIEKVRNSHPAGDPGIQFTSHMTFEIEGQTYPLPLTDSQIHHRLSAELDGMTYWVSAPEDVLILKALLQRGPDQGKHDIEDVQNFLKLYPDVNRGYITVRLKEIGGEKRARPVLKALLG